MNNNSGLSKAKRNLSDLLQEKLNQKKVQVWYQTTDTFRHAAGLGLEYAMKSGLKAETGETHKFIGSIQMPNNIPDAQLLEQVFTMMQGEVWSPRGEAREIISNAGVGHTSMSCGDMVQINNQFFSCEMAGFKNVTDLIKHEEPTKTAEHKQLMDNESSMSM